MSNNQEDVPKDKFEAAMKETIDQVLVLANKDREAGESYKSLLEEQTVGSVLFEGERRMMRVVLDMCAVLKNKFGAATLSREAFDILLGLPLVAHRLEQEFVEKEGPACSVDKTYATLDISIQKMCGIYKEPEA